MGIKMFGTSINVPTVGTSNYCFPLRSKNLRSNDKLDFIWKNYSYVYNLYVTIHMLNASLDFKVTIIIIYATDFSKIA